MLNWLKRNQNPFLNVKPEVLLRYDHLAIHCSATPPHMDLDAAWVDDLHRNQFNWKNGNGYHAVLTRPGEIQLDVLGNPCRPLHMAGAHVGDCGPGWNTRTLGVCYIGGVDKNDVPQDNKTEEQEKALAQVIRWFFEAHPKPWTITILGHRDLIRQTGAAPKACPSFDVQEWLDKRKPLAGLDYQSDLEDLGRKCRMPSPATHTVRAGETYWAIANTYGLKVPDLTRLNYIRPEKLKPGDVIKLR